MPHTITKTFYACDKCGHEYNQFHDATMCETVPLLEDTEGLEQFNVGDELNFNNESQSWTRWIYSSGSGKIVEKKLIRHQDKHQYLYWCDSGEGALWVKDDFGWKMFSPAELKRNAHANFY